MVRYRAALFDWRGTLVHIPDDEWHVERALTSIGRQVGSEIVSTLVRAVGATRERPEFVDAERFIDCSAEIHRETSMRIFRHAGLDDELATALYEVDVDPSEHPIYPDAREVLNAIHDLEVKIAVVSDIHFDVRSHLAADGVSDLIDGYVLSFEHGFQKPDPRMFKLALDTFGVEPHESLMIGDRASPDGGAVSVGIPTLILPRSTGFGPRGLDVALRLLSFE